MTQLKQCTSAWSHAMEDGSAHQDLLNNLRQHGKVTKSMREVAMLVCLILSAATPDNVCMLSTMSLFKAGLLDLSKLSQASKDEIKKYTQRSGIYNNRAAYLKSMATKVMKDHGGSIPPCLDALMSFNGAARKTAALVMNEVFGITEGIGTDAHVMEMSIALGFIQEPKSLKLNREHVEQSLLTWNLNPMSMRMCNPIVGGFVQTFTNQLKSIDDEETKLYSKLVVLSCSDHIHRAYHVELMWCAIMKARLHHSQRRSQ